MTLSKTIFAALTTLFLLFSSQTQAAGDQAAGKLKAPMCAACHGATGQSSMPAMPGMVVPNIGGQYADYLVKALTDYRSGARVNASMSGIAAGLPDDDIENLAAYYASQTGLTVVNSQK